MSPAGVDELFRRVAMRMLTDDAVESGRMFGSDGLETGGKIFAMVVRDELVVKLPAECVDELVDAGRGRRFDPGHGHRLKEWVGVRPKSEAACEAYMAAAREFVAASLAS